MSVDAQNREILGGVQEPDRPLTEGQVQAFRHQGFLAIERFAPPAEVLALRPVYLKLFAGRSGWKDGNFFDFAGRDGEAGPVQAPQLLHLSRYAPELLAHPVMQRGLAIARQILGPTARLMVDHGILKPSDGSAPTPWHQDEAFWAEGFDHDGLSIWIPLQDVNESSGCMQFAPCSHKRPVLKHRTIGDDPRVHGLEVVGRQPAEVVKCPLRLGGATLHHARTLHYSAPNVSGADRLAYVLVFLGRVRRRLIPRAHRWNRGKHPARVGRTRTLRA